MLWLWREITRFFIVFELLCFKAVQKVIRPRFVLQGQCQKRGECCKRIVALPPRLLQKQPFNRWFIAFHRLTHNFHQVGTGPEGAIIFSCHHLKTDGRCGIYAYRPLICRTYPVVPFFGTPHLLPGCGYSIAPREVAVMQKRSSLTILNANVSVHHPTPEGDPELAENFHLVDTLQR